MKVVAQSAWAVMFQIGAATAAVIGLLCVGALLSTAIDWMFR